MLLFFGFPMPIHDMMKSWSHLLVDEVGGSNWQLGLIDCSNTTTIRLDRQFFSTVNDLKGKDVKTVSNSCINISLRRQNFEFLIFFCSKFEISKNWGWAQFDIATEKKCWSKLNLISEWNVSFLIVNAKQKQSWRYLLLSRRKLPKTEFLATIHSFWWQLQYSGPEPSVLSWTKLTRLVQ